MARFYGTMQGDNRKEVTRCGRTELSVVGASWQGAVQVNLSRNGDIDHVYVFLTPWHGKGMYRMLYSGPVSGEVKGVKDDKVSVVQGSTGSDGS